MTGRMIRVPMEAIAWDDDTYRSSLDRDLDALRESIRTAGLLCATWVQKRLDGYRVVNGFRRAAALREMGAGELPAEQVDEAAKKEDVLLRALHENRFSRGFSWAERAWVINRVVCRWGAARQWVLGRLMPALGLPSAQRVLDEHLSAARLRPAVFRALNRKGFSLANALRLVRWPEADQEAVLPLLEKLHLTESLLRECLDIIREIALREGVSPALFLDRRECREIIEDPDRDRMRRTRDFRDLLKRRRYPMLVSMEQAFRNAIGGLGLPGQLSIRPAAGFERKGVTVRFDARDPAEFRSLAGKLWAVSKKKGALDRLFQATEI